MILNVVRLTIIIIIIMYNNTNFHVSFMVVKQNCLIYIVSMYYGKGSKNGGETKFRN